MADVPAPASLCADDVLRARDRLSGGFGEAPPDEQPFGDPKLQ